MRWMFDPDNHGIDASAGFGILDEYESPTGITIHGQWDDEHARKLAQFVAAGPELLDCLDDLVTWFDCNPDVEGLEHEADDFSRARPRTRP